MIQIIPAIDAFDKVQFEADLQKIEGCEELRDGWLHLDFGDGKFVETKTILPEDIEKKSFQYFLEIHLMVVDPINWLEKLKPLQPKRVIVHIESENISEFINIAKDQGLEIGLAIKYQTPIEKLVPFLSTIDEVLVMTIEPGPQGQPFIEESLSKVKELTKLRGNHNFNIGVDGHINDQTAKKVVEAGAEQLVIGSYFLEGVIEENVEKIWEVINS